MARGVWKIVNTGEKIEKGGTYRDRQPLFTSYMCEAWSIKMGTGE